MRENLGPFNVKSLGMGSQEEGHPNEIIPNAPFDFFGLRQVELAQTTKNENQAPEPAPIQQQQGLANAQEANQDPWPTLAPHGP